MPLNAWNVPSSSCNRMVQERIEARKHEKHLQAVENIKGLVNTSRPKQIALDKEHSKTRKLQKDRALAIQIENRHLLQKMSAIDTKVSDMHPKVMMGKGRVQAKSLLGGAQRRELDRITDSNQELLKRLQGAKSSIDRPAWEDAEIDRQALKFRLCQNSNRGRAAQAFRMPERSASTGTIAKHLGSGASGRTAEEEWTAITDAQLERIDRQLEHGFGSSATLVRAGMDEVGRGHA